MLCRRQKRPLQLCAAAFEEFAASQRLGLAAAQNIETHKTSNLERTRMKRSKWIIAALMTVTLAGITLGVTGCKGPESARNQSQSGNQAIQYTCSMHPEVVQDKPGKCPKCGMDLVEKH
jgi:Cu(I)/Ag(I) efflux system membrane fusion protein